MKAKGLGTISAAVAIGVILALAIMLAFGSPRVSQADSVVGTGNWTLLSSTGVTGTVTGTAYYSQYWGTADCYSVYVEASGNATTTMLLQHSPDSTNWVTGYTYAQQTSAGMGFTRTVLYGAYMRAIAQISGTNPLTVSVKCAGKNVTQ